MPHTRFNVTMVSTIPLLQALMLCVLAISSFASVKALPSHQGGHLIKRESYSQCGSSDMSLKDEKAFKLDPDMWSKGVYSSFKGGNLNVIFTYENGGGIRDTQFMEIQNKSSTDYIIFVYAKKVVDGEKSGKFDATSKAFKIKAKSICRAEVLSGATISSVYEVDAQKASS
jgi:hypothetical protein